MKNYEYILSSLRRNLSNIYGFRSNKKVIVFESDDWGSIRMPSLSTFKKLEKSGLDLRSMTAGDYNLNDTLATSADLEGLFEILSRHKDSLANNPVFTAVSVVANPDFEKICATNFCNYIHEPFTETLKRYPGCENSFELWKVGILNRLFIPQMHGREHLNVSAWMKALKNGDKQTIEAFNEGFCGFVPNQKLYSGIDYQAAFLFSSPEELKQHEIIIKEGLDLFERLFGYRAKYFVPPNGPFSNSLNKVLVENGIKFRSVSKIQNEPTGEGRKKKSFHWLGQEDKSGIRYITRNCFFEPTIHNQDWVDSCLNDIKISFRWDKPAIISTHRVNYIGALNHKNRENGLIKLDMLIKLIIKNWPDVIFMTTPDLGNLINHSS